MSLDSEPSLIGEDARCQGCHHEFSPIPDSDEARTFLSCGHSVCFKCIQTEWCRSASNEVGMVNCPVCKVEVLICFEEQTMTDVDEQPLESARINMSNVLQKAHQHSQPTTSIPIIQPTPGCSDVLMCQTAEENVTNGHFPGLPLSIADSLIDMAEMGPDMAEMGSGIDFQGTDNADNLADKSWSMDIMNFHEMLEKNDITKHFSQDSIFSDHSDSDMGSVQDILKIANLPGDSLLDDNSLSAIFLPENSNDTTSFNDNLKISLTGSEINELSQFLHPTPTPVTIQTKTMPQDNSTSSLEGVEIHIKDNSSSINNNINTFEEASVDQKRLLDKLEAENDLLQTDQYFQPTKSRGRRRYGSRGRRRRAALDLAAMDSLNSETLSAVASIQEGNSCKPNLPKHDRLVSLKENLHERFYPKSSRKLLQKCAMEIPIDRNLRHKLFFPNRDEIEIPDMQMVKIVSDVQLPEIKEPLVEELDESDNHNYGYVKNAMLPNGNEIKNLYVVPKTWLNNDEVEVQFAPTGTDTGDFDQSSHLGMPMEKPSHTSPSLSRRYPASNVLPARLSNSWIQHSAFLQNKPPVLQESVVPNTLQRYAPETTHQTNLQRIVAEDTVPKLHCKSDTHKARPKKAEPEMIHVSQALKTSCDTPESSVVRTTIAKSLIDNTHKVIKVWSKETESKSVGKEVHITKLPQHDDLISSEEFETEMVHVRYEINDDQIVFIPETEASDYDNVTKELPGEEKGPLLILTVQENDTSSNELSDVGTVTTKEQECIPTDRQTKRGKLDKNTSVKSLLQSDDFFPPCTQKKLDKGKNKTRRKCSGNLKESVNLSSLVDKCIQAFPGSSNSTDSLDSFVSRPPTASSSNNSLQRMFSSPESVRPEDIQEWYKSGDNSRETSNLELQPWEPMPDNYEEGLFCAEFSEILENDDKIQDIPCDVSGMISEHDKINSTEYPFGDNGYSIQNIGDAQTLQAVVTSNHFATALSLCHGTSADKTDYGSPPELEKMVMLPHEEKLVSNKSHIANQPAPTSSDLECDSTSELNLKGINKPKEERSDTAIRTKLDICQNLQLEKILDQLYEISQKNEAKSDVHMLISQVYKVKEINMNVDEEAGLQTDQLNEMFSLILDQVSSLLACKSSAHVLETNTCVYSKDVQEAICKQKNLLRKVVETGVSLVVRLSAEYEKTVKQITDCSSVVDVSHLDDAEGHVREGDKEYPLFQISEMDVPNNITGQIEDFGIVQGEEAEHEENRGLDPELIVSQDLDQTSHLDDVVKIVGFENKYDTLKKEDNLEESRNPNIADDKEGSQRADVVVKSSSETTLAGNVSNIALNVEIASSTSNESVLPSLSDVLRETNLNQTCSPIINREKNKDKRRTSDDVIMDPDYEEDKENSDNSSSSKEGDDDGEEEEGDLQPKARSGQAGHVEQNSKKRKLRCLHDDEVTERSLAATPKKKRGTSSQSSTPSKSTKSTGKKTGKKKKRTKAKDIYASSSEEIIPTPIKRGFQYTDECFRMFNTVYNHKRSDPFCKEILSADVPGYYKVVKRAMWLDLVAQKLRTGRYDCIEEYVADMRLVFENSRRFNKKDSEVYESGLICERLFEKILVEQFPDKYL